VIGNVLITSSVFWKYTCGKARASIDTPVYSNSEFHKEILKSGLKRLTGVRWRDPNINSDREKIEYHCQELMKLGYGLDMDTIHKQLHLLLKDHDSRKPPKPLKSHSKKKNIHQQNADIGPLLNQVAETVSLPPHSFNSVSGPTIDPNQIQQLLAVLTNLLNILQKHQIMHDD